MQSHWFRTLSIIAIVVVAALNFYPTLVWMTKSPDQRAALVEQIREDDLQARLENHGLMQRGMTGLKHWAAGDPSRIITLGLDLQGGLHMVIGFDMTDEMRERDLTESEVRDIIQETIQNRVNEFDVQEPIIQKLGANQVQIQLPGVKDENRAKDIIMRNAKLGFHIVSGREATEQVLIRMDRQFNNELIPFLAPPEMPGGPYQIPQENYEYVKDLILEAEKVEGIVPEGQMMAFSPPPSAWDEGGYEIYMMEDRASVTGEGLKTAVARPNTQSPGQWLILFEFNAQAANDFATLTENNIDRDLGIVLDGNVVSAPTIRARIFGSGEIEGNFTADEARDVAISLNSGSMPVTLREDYTGYVGPTLGADSVRSGVVSSVSGLILVMVFMIFYYRLAGIIANVALAVNAILILGAFAYFDVTLTLPGIAGLILTIGMAVDANVLIFERIREELRSGKSLANSIDGGYELATSTILDANITTLIASVVLLQFGTGPVQGFAVALSIGICTSVFAALIVTRAVFDFLKDRKMIANVSMASVIKGEPSFKFLEHRRTAATISAVVIAVGIGMFGFRGQDMFGVDFTNGTNMIVALNAQEDVPVGALRDALTDAGFDSPSVQEYAEGGEMVKNQFIVRVAADIDPALAAANQQPIEETPAAEGAEGEETAAEAPASEETAAVAGTVSTHVQEALAPLADLGGELDEAVSLLKVETVGPAVGAKLQRDAGLAVGYALIFIVFYLWFRFELKFAAGAVLALVHDVLVVIGIFALFGREITVPVVAALLTIIGYSLNDTIVVFDRVREDVSQFKSRTTTFMDVLNTSINRTLSRTVLTSLTTFFVVTILFIFGGSAINDFAFALIAGVIVGTYSSIFIATPAVLYLEQRRSRRAEEQAKEDKGKSGKKKGGAKNQSATAN